MSTLTVIQAEIDVNGVVVAARRTGDNVYLLTFDNGFEYSVKGYDNVVAAAEGFAAEASKLSVVRSSEKQAAQSLEAFAVAKRAEFENAK